MLSFRKQRQPASLAGCPIIERSDILACSGFHPTPPKMTQDSTSKQTSFLAHSVNKSASQLVAAYNRVSS